MPRYLISFVFLFIFFIPKLTSAQYYYYNDKYYDNHWIFELGASLNAMNCLTDLGGHKGIGERFLKDLNLGKTRLAGGVFVSMMYKYAATIRLETTFGQIEGNDYVLKGVTDIAKERFNRNLSVKSPINEVSLMAELHPLFMFIDWPSKDREPYRLSPYVVFGYGFFKFNPRTTWQGQRIFLQPLSTEGQGFSEFPDRPAYKLKQDVIPYGLGFRYDLGPLVNLRVEGVARRTGTDYLDDVSKTYIDPNLFYKYFSGYQLQQALALNDRRFEKRLGTRRGLPHQDDSYFTICLKLSITLGRDRVY